MSRNLDRAGRFKAIPLTWEVVAAQSGAVAISIDFLILAELDGETWTSWKDYEEHVVPGSFWIVKKDGKPNQTPIDQLVHALGWDGDLEKVRGEAPQREVQVTVKEDTFRDVTRFKVDWMDPGDANPNAGAASTTEVKAVQARFGSLLRAAAAGAAKASGTATAPPPKTGGKKAAPPKKGAPPPKDSAKESDENPPLDERGQPMVRNPISGEWEEQGWDPLPEQKSA